MMKKDIQRRANQKRMIVHRPQNEGFIENPINLAVSKASITPIDSTSNTINTWMGFLEGSHETIKISIPPIRNLYKSDSNILKISLLPQIPFSLSKESCK
jgi:hypothetical protein